MLLAQPECQDQSARNGPLKVAETFNQTRILRRSGRPTTHRQSSKARGRDLLHAARGKSACQPFPTSSKNRLQPQWHAPLVVDNEILMAQPVWQPNKTSGRLRANIHLHRLSRRKSERGDSVRSIRMPDWEVTKVSVFCGMSLHVKIASWWKG